MCFSANATCTISGNVHYKTFDFQMIHYEGTCKHILVETTYDSPNQFTIYAKNEQYYNSSVSVMKYIEIVFDDTTIRFWRNSLSSIDGINVAKVALSNDPSPPDIQVNFITNYYYLIS